MEKSLTTLLIPGGNRRYYVVRWIDPATGNNRQRSTRTTNLKAALKAQGKLEDDIREQRLDFRQPIRWAEFRERYEAEHLSTTRQSTMLKVCTVLDVVEEILKPRFVSDINAEAISRFRREVWERPSVDSSDTVDGYVRHLRAALGWAADIDLICQRPKVPRGHNTGKKRMLGRPITLEEFERMLACTPTVVGDKAADSWRYLLQGLYWSGLRIGEAFVLGWTDEHELRVDMSRRRPLFRIPGEIEKGGKDRLLPMAPEFAKLLEKTPAEDRSGFVFDPQGKRRDLRVGVNYGVHIIADIGETAVVKVKSRGKNGKPKYASSHDLRRTFGERWASRVMPPELMELMRHESIETTLKFYVGRNADRTTSRIWEAYEQSNQQTRQLGDTLSDTGSLEEADALRQY